MIRPAKSTEIKTVLAWHFRHVDTAPDGRAGFAEKFPVEYARINNIVAGNQGQVFIAECNGAPVGYIGIAIDKTPRSSHAEVCGFYVLPQHRKNGYGRALAEHAIKAAKQESVRSLSVEVGLKKPWLIDFYASVGFLPASMNMHQNFV